MSQAAELSADEAAPAADHVYPIPIGAAPAPIQEDRRFWYGLAVAAVLHALLFVGVGKSPHRQMGEPEGSLEGVSVELIDAADFLSRTTVPVAAAPPAAPPAPASEPAPAETAPEPSPAEAEPESAAEAEPEPQKSEPEKSPDQKSEPQKPDSRKEVTASSIQEVAPDLFSLSKPTREQNESTSDTPAKRKSRPSRPAAPRLKMTMPDLPLSAAPQSAAVGRPPGITRSGENDDFGRGVVRALRQTMPPPRFGQTGRVTIRLLLTMRGNIDQVRVIKSSGIPSLDQSVLFASQQSSFPFPPKGATVADRTFLVTYIYN